MTHNNFLLSVFNIGILYIVFIIKAITFLEHFGIKTDFVITFS
tara:strand:+ start:757 stop:885 length:129 start_codon:yes stop_codon:yes gene_type:complete